MSRARVIAALAAYVAFMAMLTLMRGDALMVALLVTRFVVFGSLILFLRGSPPALEVPLRWLMILPVALLLASAQWVAVAPGTADEFAYRFQASAITNLSLSAEPPPGEKEVNLLQRTPFYFIHHVIHDGKWFGKYPPGWPALLSIGLWLRMERFWSAFFGIATVWATYRLAELWFDRSTATIAVVLLCLSPMFLYNSAGWFSHASCGALLAVALLFFAKRSFAVAFAIAAASILIRPLTGLCGLVVLVAASVVWSRGQAWKSLAIASVSALAAALLLAAYNNHLTGDPFRSTYALYTGTVSTQEATFTLDNVARNLRWLTANSVALTETATAPFLLLAAIASPFIAPKAERFRLCTLLGLFAAMVLAYLSQVEPSFSMVGERYYYEALFALAIAAARAWMVMGGRLGMDLRHLLAVTALLQLAPLLHYGAAVRSAVTPFAAMLNHVKSARGVVYIRWSPQFESRDFNPNPAGWKRAAVFAMTDPGSHLHREIACKLGYREWRLVTWDPALRSVRVLSNSAGCPSGIE